MNNLMPYYVIFLLILIIIILWYFYGGKEDCKFVGLDPLQPGNIITATSEYETIESSICITNTNENNVIIDNVVNSVVDSVSSIKSVCGNSDVKTEEECKEEKINILEEITYNTEEALSNSDDSNDEDIMHDIPLLYNPNNEIDLTPKLPEEFTNKVYVKENNKFESKGEQICRDTMQKIYGVPFINTRPFWLRNPTSGRCLELDCYNEKLKLAVEYQGQQHMKWCDFTKQSYNDFRNQVYRDRIKVKLCKKQGVYLIVVPYNVPFNLIPTYIIHHLPEIVRKRLKETQEI